MEDQYIRTRWLVGDEGISRLRSSHVAVFGIGGVGGHAAEALARCGVGTLTVVDSHSVTLGNLNRQIIATHNTLGMPKVEAMKNRIREIDPTIRVHTRQMRILPGQEGDIIAPGMDFILDAVDTVAAKLLIVERAYALGIPVISSMGTGNKMDPTCLTIARIEDTRVCPLARIMRRELKKRGISGVRVVYSTELPRKTYNIDPEGEKRNPPASIAFVPPVAGLMMASAAVRTILGEPI